jgi:GLPGLI family protein
MMMYHIILYWIGILTLAPSQTNSNLSIAYSVKFNDEFDRGRKERLYQASLEISDGKSMYYMVAKESFQPTDEHDLRFTPDSSHLVFTSQNESVLIAQEYGFNGKAFFVSDSLYPMVWEILPEEKQIDSLVCVKARCQFRGREYIAWFVPEIPLPYGPWKMGGLPGLIVDLQDVDENLVIQLQSIQFKSSAFELPNKVKYTMDKHIEELKKITQRLQQSASVDQSGNCLSCKGSSKANFYFWEKLPQ